MPVLCVGSCEGLKAGVHATLGLLVAVCAVYNACAYLFVRREPHLAVNAVIYTAAIAWEGHHVRHHTARQQLDQSHADRP